MNLSLSFLANDITQLPMPGKYGNTGVEAVLFDRDHLKKEYWELGWKNVREAARLYGSKNVTYHFPVNESDYVQDAYVRQKLFDAYMRACDLGLAGLVVHSNRIRECGTWRKFDPFAERNRVTELLSRIRAADESSATWLGLENMPIVGNFGLETDPLFAFADDFKNTPPNVGVVWDVCHAMSSLAYIAAFQKGLLPKTVIARFDDFLSFDPSILNNRIVHWHFAAHKGLNNPDANTVCIEGVLPTEGDLESGIYESAMRKIAQTTGTMRTVNFEVREEDYQNRWRGPAIIDWAKRILNAH